MGNVYSAYVWGGVIDRVKEAWLSVGVVVLVVTFGVVGVEIGRGVGVVVVVLGFIVVWVVLFELQLTNDITKESNATRVNVIVIRIKRLRISDVLDDT